ncbi:MAG: hypothetical protein MZU97_24370 [Bacillus subtilis]|nr:hypothetical protein [Bacillus subtilis]
MSFGVAAWLMVIHRSVLLNHFLDYLHHRQDWSFGQTIYGVSVAIELEKNELIEEIAKLNDKVVDLVEEKNQILAMKSITTRYQRHHRSTLRTDIRQPGQRSSLLRISRRCSARAEMAAAHRLFQAKRTQWLQHFIERQEWPRWIHEM